MKLRILSAIVAALAFTPAVDAQFFSQTTVVSQPQAVFASTGCGGGAVASFAPQFSGGFFTPNVVAFNPFFASRGAFFGSPGFIGASQFGFGGPAFVGGFGGGFGGFGGAAFIGRSRVVGIGGGGFFVGGRRGFVVGRRF
jgi:hypothetical protein